MNARKILASALGLCVISTLIAQPTQAATTLTTVLVANGLSLPDFVTHAPNDYDRLFVIEKRGLIRIIDHGVLLPTAFLNIDSLVGGGTSAGDERGLLGLAFHPDYATNGYFYVDYVNNSNNTIIARYSVSAGDPNIANSTSGLQILQVTQPSTTNHKGGWIGFGPDNYLYIAMGDGGGADDEGAGHIEPGGNGQSIQTLLGKMLRINVDADDFPADPAKNYGIPGDNPFAGATTGLDEIWAYGLRNPWRNSFDRLTGDLWIADVGQNLYEEIDFQPAGAAGGVNYGWRCKEGFHNFNFSDDCPNATLTDPIYEYQHTGGSCAVMGGYVYRGCAIPDLEGTYFFADYCSKQIWSFQYVGGVVTNFTERTAELDPIGGQTIGAIVSFGQDAYGELYLVDEFNGQIFKIIARDGFVNGDCNANLVDDACDIASGASQDTNGNGVPDECEGCVGDVNGDGSTTLEDLAAQLAAYGTCSGDPAYLASADLDISGCIDLTDLSILLADYGCVP